MPPRPRRRSGHAKLGTWSLLLRSLTMAQIPVVSVIIIVHLMNYLRRFVVTSLHQMFRHAQFSLRRHPNQFNLTSPQNELIVGVSLIVDHVYR